MMSVNKSEEESPVPVSLDVAESPRKKMRLDSSGRKSWSLMDRKTDHEVLQEMGVSLLEPDDNDILCDPDVSGMAHKQLKRKRDIENVNPNITIVTSPRSKFSPKSPRKAHPDAGPSRVKSPRSSEKQTPLKPTDQQTLETTLLDSYVTDSETPLAQHDASHGSHRSTGTESKGVCFHALSDEVILGVFRWLPKRTLAHCMLVCKRWNRIACDETLWQRLELGNKTLARDAVGRILARKPIIVRLASSEIGEWHPPTPPPPSRIQYLDLSMSTVDVTTLDNLLQTCRNLKKLSLESVLLHQHTCTLIGKCSNLETLNLTMAQGITAEGLQAILEGCTSLLSLNISWCNLSEEALEVFVTSCPQRLQRLNIGGARIMTDEIIERLVLRCPRLLELDISDCGRLTSSSALSLVSLQRLEHLALSRCYLLPATALTQLGSMPSLQYVDVWGMLHTHALNALRAALPHVQINTFKFSAIARPTVGTRRTSIWGLRTRD
nr:S-phase kinase-associated protein 2-like [Helicoverpa armigera]